MTKEELEDLVREIYGMYGKDLYETDRPHIMRGWWTHLHDQDITQVRETVQQVTVVERYMPPAGHIKLEHLRRLCDNPPPTPQEFWALIQNLIHSRNSGTYTPQKTPTKTPEKNPPQKNPNKTPEKNNPPKSGPTKTPHLQHPTTQQTIQELGQALYTLTTNQDRQFALDAYTRHCLNWLQGQNS